MLFYFNRYCDYHHLLSFPTRRSSDLATVIGVSCIAPAYTLTSGLGPTISTVGTQVPAILDRKSTRLNSSHVAISYAVFCLKKTTICAYSACRSRTRNTTQTSPRYICT